MCSSCSCSTTADTSAAPPPGRAGQTPDELRYVVGGMSCGHCESAVTEELKRVPGVSSVAVDLATKLVLVQGVGVDDAAARAAIEEAGYEAVEA